MNATRLIAVLAVVGISCSSAFAVRDPSVSIEELKKQRTAVQREMDLNNKKLKKPDISLSAKQKLQEDQKRLRQQNIELQRSIKLSEWVQSNESVMYANE